MRNYLIIVEGAHDIAVIEKVLSLNGINKRVNQEEDLPEVWKHVIPTRYPFEQSRLDRIAPIPSFVKNDNISVAIKNATSDTEIIDTLQHMLHYMEIGDVAKLEGIMLICDADLKNASKKRETLLNMWEDTQELKLDKMNMQLETSVRKIPIYMFVFPDDCNPGNLENLLLETAKVAYPELLQWALEYIEKAADISKNLKREQDAKKATIGCIANTMKPGKANQVSIADNDWITENTLRECEMLGKLDGAVKNMLDN